MASAIVLLMFLMVQLTVIGSGVGDEEEPVLSEVPTRGDPYIEEDGNLLKIGNDHIEMVLNMDVNGGITELIDRSTGEDLRGNKVPPPVLFMLMYWTGNATDIVIQWDAAVMTSDQIERTEYAELTLNYHKFRGNNLNATVTIRLEKESRYFDMRLDIQNDEDFTVRSIFFPVVWGIDKIGDLGEDDRFFYPVGDGLLLKDPIEYKDDLHMAEIYPSTASMQMMCYYDENGTGFYLTTDDGNGHPKKPTFDSMEWSAETHPAMFFENLIPEYVGNDYQMPYSCRLGSFEGDWYDAADIYKEWAQTTDFMKGGKVFEDKDTPDWWAKTSVISSSNRDADLVHNSLSDIENMTAEFNELTGVNTTHLIFAWAKNGAWCGPYYFPPAAGEDNFINSMTNISEMGSHAILYISGSVWRITRGDIGYEDHELFNDIGKQWACMDQYGNPTIDQGYLAINWTSARMCPMTDFWQEMVINNTSDCIDLGVDVVQIDEFPIGSVYPCYNTSHGHPLGYSNEITNSYRHILNGSRQNGRMKNDDLIMSMEEPCEFYIPYMDTYVSRDNSPEFMIYPFAVQIYGDDVEFIPFFSHVYHEYITAFAEPIPMNHDYPEPFIGQMRRSIARAFISGEIISGSADEKENLRPEVISLYNTTVRASTGYCNDYLLKGEPLRPPEIDVPDEPVDWFFYSQQKAGRTFNETSILHSSSKADNGDIGHVFVNWIDEDVEFDVTLPQYDLEGEYTIFITRNGEREVLFKRTTLPVNVTMNTTSGDVILIEITRVADMIIHDLVVRSYEGPYLTNETYQVEFIILNDGTDGTGPFELDLRSNDLVVDRIFYPDLMAKQADVISFTLNTTGLIGTYNISVYLDKNDNVTEIHETNNIAWQIIEVLERPRACLNVVAINSSTGLPLRNVSVEISLMGSDLLISNKTGPSGEVRFPGLIAGSYGIRSYKNHFWINYTNVELEEGENGSVEVLMKWREYPYISGKVIDNYTGEPIEGAMVSLTLEMVMDYPILLRTIDTDDNGSFNFTDLDRSSIYGIRIFYPGYDEFENIYFFSVSRDLIIRLDSYLGNIEGIVTDKENGSPIEGVTVKISSHDREIVTDASGAFDITNMVIGSYELSLSKDGYRPYSVEVLVESHRTTTISIELEVVEPTIPSFNITGRVINKDGVPIKDALIVIKELDISTRSNLNGYFRFEDLEKGNYTLIISAEGYGDLEIAVTSDDTDPVITLETKKNDDEGPFPIWLILLIIASALVLAILAIFLVMIGRTPRQFEE